MAPDEPSEMTPPRTVPPTLTRARELLLEHGALSLDVLQKMLRKEGLVLSPDRLASLPTTYPQYFDETADDLLIAVRPTVAAPVPDSTLGSKAPDELEVPIDDVPRIDRSMVVVIDIETTGLDRSSDEIWEIAARNLGNGEEFQCRVAATPGSPRIPELAPGEVETTLPEALSALAEFLVGAEGVAGHNIAVFDLPFLAERARQADIEWNAPAQVFDLMLLSTLDAPTRVSRTLGDLSRAANVDLVDAHRAQADVRATAGVINELLDRIDPGDASWAVASACLARAGDSWPALFPEFEPLDPVDALVPASDELCSAGPTDHIDQDGWTDRAFEHLAETRDGFRPRASQLEMAKAVTRAMNHSELLAVEAPTGTGKSLAYLLPAVARAGRGQPVVISTATRVLQQQLRRDAETLRADGLLPVPYRQLQGVSNYLCTREIASALGEDQMGQGEWVAAAVAVRALATASTGTWTEVNDWHLRQRSPGYLGRRLRLVTTSNDCERSHCAYVKQCPLFRRLDGLSDNPGILAVNHALLAMWSEIRRRGGKAPGDVLADNRSALVFDEAHELEDSLTSAWTEELSAASLAIVDPMVWGRRGPIAIALSSRESADHPQFTDALKSLNGFRRHLVPMIEQLDVSVGAYLHEYGGRDHVSVLTPGLQSSRPEFKAVGVAALELVTLLRDICLGLGALLDLLDSATGAENGAEETPNGREGAPNAADPPASGAQRDDDDEEADPSRSSRRGGGRLRRRIKGVVADLEELRELVASMRDLRDAHAFVHVLSDRERAAGPESVADWLFQRIPIDVGERFANDLVKPARSVVLTSATLLVADSFDFLGRRLGVRGEDSRPAATEPITDDARPTFSVRQLESPFDYDEQSAVVLTSHLPFPSPANERAFCEELAADQVGLLSLTKGRALTLFAARTRMERVAELVREYEGELDDRGVHLLVQGELSAATISEQFRSDHGSVVYGLRSYWQGFDAPGETLSLLFVEKPPYPHPGDPITAARQRAIADAGGDPFLDYVVPRTAITFAQGFGRLIRHETDRGVTIVYDRRVQLPNQANGILLGTLPTKRVFHAVDRDDAWRHALKFVDGGDPDLSEAIVTRQDRTTELLASLRLAEGEDPEAKLRAAAAALFDIDHLHDEQVAVMRALLSGRDALGVLPTGFGKSLCFQLPALLGPGDGVTVVVSPLIALIKDQVDELRGRRGLRQVHGITGKTTVAERTEVLREVSDGRTRLLYVSPERLTADPSLRRALAASRVRAIVVDEVHCVNVWGADFRPEYRQIAAAVEELPRSARIGLTATATPAVQRDVVETLELEDPATVLRRVDRPNLRFLARRVKSDDDRVRELLRFLVAMEGKPGIVYAHRRATTDELAWLLRQAQINARSYHAGLLQEQRDAVQDDFLSGQTQVVVATKAFGMGINKPDIGWVLHYDLPESLEAYTQEAGRAARDDRISGECMLLFSARDVARRRSLLQRNDLERDLVETRNVLRALSNARTRGRYRVFDPDEFAKEVGIDRDRLNLMVAWLDRTNAARRVTDCSLRGTVSVGFREPEDISQRRFFRDLFSVKIRTQPNVRKQIDFVELEEQFGLDPDVLEDQLVAWTMARLVVFNTSVRGWRVEIRSKSFDEGLYRSQISQWRAWESQRLEAMVEYSRGAVCRRIEIARHFGDDERDCRSSSDNRLCDVCEPRAHQSIAVPESRVPDPDALVQVDVVVLQAVAWSSSFQHGRYGEVGLKAALLGRAGFASGRPLGKGFLMCPQFGALRYLRSGERRLTEAIEYLIAGQQLQRDRVSASDREYASLSITDVGRRALGGFRG